MCIIFVKPKNVELPSEEIMKQCWRTNDDGAGYMFSVPNGVVIKKGFMAYDSFRNSILNEKKLIEKTVVAHFRISTGGGITPQMTHPFPVSKRFEDITRLTLFTQWALAHNGCLGDTRLKYDHSIMSDTAAFAMQCAPFNDFTNPDVQKAMCKLGWLRIAFLGPNNQLIILNEKEGVWDKGIWYSHHGYKPYVWNNVSYEEDDAYWERRRRSNISIYEYDKYGRRIMKIEDAEDYKEWWEKQALDRAEDIRGPLLLGHRLLK